MAVRRVLERREAFLEGRARRVRDTGVVVPLVDAHRLLREGRRLVDRRDHGPGRRIRLLSRMDRLRLEVHAGDGTQGSARTRDPRRPEPSAESAASASSSRDVSPQAPSTSSVPVSGRSAARRARRAGRRRGSAGRSSRTPASPWDEHLEAVPEAEERLGPVAVVDQAVEGREQRDPVGDLAAAGVRMRLPALGRDESDTRARGSAVPRAPAAPCGQRDSSVCG